MTKQEVADAANVSVRTVERAIARNDLQAAKTGHQGRVRIRYAWFLDWLKPQNPGPLILPLVLDDRVQAILTALVAAVGMAAVCYCFLDVCTLVA